jgi:hypothetical protein
MAGSPRARSTGKSPLETFDPRAGETPSQDIAPTEEDIRLEAALVERRRHTTNLSDWSEAGNRLQQGGGIGTPIERADDEDEEADDEEEADEEDEEDDEDDDADELDDEDDDEEEDEG